MLRPGPNKQTTRPASPVEVADEALLVAQAQLAQQSLVLPEQADVVGEGEGLPGQAGEALQPLVGVQPQPEVVPQLGAARHHAAALHAQQVSQGESGRGGVTPPGGGAHLLLGEIPEVVGGPGSAHVQVEESHRQLPTWREDRRSVLPPCGGGCD